MKENTPYCLHIIEHSYVAICDLIHLHINTNKICLMNMYKSLKEKR